MPKTPAKKLLALRQSGTLHPGAEKVRDPLFVWSVFFDANDLLQVKYEMLRSIQVDGRSIAGAAEEFGLSRPTVYEARAHFKAKGLEGLLPETYTSFLHRGRVCATNQDNSFTRVSLFGRRRESKNLAFQPARLRRPILNESG